MDINALIKTYATKKKIPYNLLYNQIKKESNLNPKATGDIGAKAGSSRGLMQIQETTAISTLKVPKKDIDKLYDPEYNINKGTDYLNMIKTELDAIGLPKTYDDYWAAIFMAYNSGPGYMKRALSNLKAKKKSNISFQDIINEMQTTGFGTTPKFEITIPYVQYIIGKTLKVFYRKPVTITTILFSGTIIYFIIKHMIKEYRKPKTTGV